MDPILQLTSRGAVAHPALEALAALAAELRHGTIASELCMDRNTTSARCNTRPGDALLFAIDDGLEHCVTRVTGTAAKTAFAGWFGTTRDFLGTLAADPRLPGEW
jgi:hypothetical protein